MKQITLKVSDEQAQKIKDGKLTLALLGKDQIDADGGMRINHNMSAKAEQSGGVTYPTEIGAATDKSAVDARASYLHLITICDAVKCLDQTAGVDAYSVDFRKAKKIVDAGRGMTNIIIFPVATD